MTKKEEIVEVPNETGIELSSVTVGSLIQIIRGKQVILDSDLAMLYQVETGAMNRAVKRNKKRFPEDFCFQLTEEEFLRCQNGISKDEGADGRGGRRYMPYAFTEQKIFFDGQIYDAFSLILSLVRKAEKEIILIDGYVDGVTLDILAKKKEGVDVRIYTYPGTALTKTDTDKFNSQYPSVSIYKTKAFHDRFLILDGSTAYHIGASIKDAGKKCFGITLLSDEKLLKELLKRLESIS